MLKISSSATSNIGKNIRTNEDNFYMNGVFLTEDNNNANGAAYSDTKDRRIQFYAVFDGMGKDARSGINKNIIFHNGQNSSLISAVMLARLQKYLKTKQEYNLDRYVHTFVRNTNKEICNYMRANNIRTGASFALLCVEKNGSVHAYNVGNSKIFMLRDNRIIQLSQNDTKVQELIHAHQIQADIARHSPDNKVLTQHLGMFENERELNLHVNSKITLKSGDKFLLCTDALCDYLTDDRIHQILSRDMSEQEIVNDFIAEALQNIGENNLTVVVVGARAVEESSEKVNLLRPENDETLNFQPLRFKKAFTIKPKHLKQIGFIVGIAVLFILAITFIINAFFNPESNGEDLETTDEVTTTEFSSVDVPAVIPELPTEYEPDIDGETSETTTDETGATDETRTGNEPVMPPIGDDGSDIFGVVGPVPTQEQVTQPIAPNATNPPPATAAPTTKAPPPVTAAPTTKAPPPATAAPTTATPTTAAPTEAPVTEAPTTEPLPIETEAPPPITDAPTEPPTAAPTEPLAPPPTEPPPVTELPPEPTIGAE